MVTADIADPGQRVEGIKMETSVRGHPAENIAPVSNDFINDITLDEPVLDGLLEAFIAQQEEHAKRNHQQSSTYSSPIHFPASHAGTHSQQSSLGRRQSASESDDSILMTPRNGFALSHGTHHFSTTSTPPPAYIHRAKLAAAAAHGMQVSRSHNSPLDQHSVGSRLYGHEGSRERDTAFVPEHGHNASITSVASLTSNGSLDLDDCTKSTSNVKRSPPAMTADHRHICRWPNCGWSFKRFEHLKRHMLIHSRERPYMCDYPGCTKGFSRSDNFAAHYRTHKQRGVVGKMKRGAYSLRACKVDGSTSPDHDARSYHEQFDMSGGLHNIDQDHFELDAPRASLEKVEGLMEDKDSNKTGRIQSRHLVSPPYAAHMMAHSMSVANAALASAGLTGLGDDYTQPITPTKKGLGISDAGIPSQQPVKFTPPHVAYQAGHASQAPSIDIGNTKSLLSNEAQYETSRTTAEIIQDESLLQNAGIELNPNSSQFGQVAFSTPYSKMLSQDQRTQIQASELSRSSSANSPGTPFTPALHAAFNRSQSGFTTHHSSPLDTRYQFRNTGQPMTPSETKAGEPNMLWHAVGHAGVPGLDESFAMSPSVSMNGLATRPEDPSITNMLPTFDAVALSRQHSAGPGVFEPHNLPTHPQGQVSIGLPLTHQNFAQPYLTNQTSSMARTFSAPGAFGGHPIGARKQRRTQFPGTPSTLSQALFSGETGFPGLDAKSASVKDAEQTRSSLNASAISDTQHGQDLMSLELDGAADSADEEGDFQMEKIFTCPSLGCSKKFARSEHLKRHVKSHSTDRPYRCDFLGCGKGFGRSDNLSQHLKLHARRNLSHPSAFPTQHFSPSGAEDRAGGPAPLAEEQRHFESLNYERPVMM